MVQHPVVELIITCEGGRHTLLDEQSNFIERKTCYIRQLTGTTVSQWLQAERLALAQRLLETTEHSVQAIAGLAGFGSAVSLRQQFSAAFGLPPLGYRRAFAS